MGPNLQDNITGVFWFAFLLFSFTTASILSGAVIERIHLGAYLFLAAVLGSVVWILAAAWGWSDSGWLYTKFGFHDWGAGGCVHTVAAFFTLGVLLNLGPRLGKYDAAGKPRVILPHNLPLTMLGLMLIFTGFYAFYAACAVLQPGGPWLSIYLTPMTLSSIAFTVTMATGIKALRERPRLGRRPKEPLLARERLEELLAGQRLEDLMARLTKPAPKKEIKEKRPPIRTSSGEVISLKRKKPNKD